MRPHGRPRSPDVPKDIESKSVEFGSNSAELASTPGQLWPAEVWASSNSCALPRDPLGSRGPTGCPVVQATERPTPRPSARPTPTHPTAPSALRCRAPPVADASRNKPPSIGKGPSEMKAEPSVRPAQARNWRGRRKWKTQRVLGQHIRGATLTMRPCRSSRRLRGRSRGRC